MQVGGRGGEGLIVETDILQETSVLFDNVNKQDVDSASQEEEVKMQEEQEEGDGEVVTAVGEEMTGGDMERGLCGENREENVGQESSPAPVKSAGARPTSAILGRYDILYYTLYSEIVCRCRQIEWAGRKMPREWRRILFHGYNIPHSNCGSVCSSFPDVSIECGSHFDRSGAASLPRV